MKLYEYKDTYEGHTSTLSNINRSIAFAGIAVVWIFKKTEAGEISLDEDFLLPVILFIAGLAFDMLQYIYQSLAWYFVFRNKERQFQERRRTEVEPSDEFEHSYWITYPAWTLFTIKVSFVIVGFTILFLRLFGTLF